ncbi:FMRFamide-like peptide 8 [Aphelenchoides avenae]|nr:FMRFamide-like peptide 8 [Aphelenchus avenae]
MMPLARQPPGSVPAYLQPEEDGAMDLDQMCERYPWLDHCQGGAMEKRKSAYMRFGRSAPSEDSTGSDSAFENLEKRKSAYMRFGKRALEGDVEVADASATEVGPEMEKRKSAYMRFGKRKSAYMRFGKRSTDVAGDDSFSGMAQKRKSAYMRFGRR